MGVPGKPMSPADISSYETVNHWFDLAADRMGLPDDLRTVLRSSYREVRVQIPIKLSDRRTHVFSGYRVQHNGARVCVVLAGGYAEDVRDTVDINAATAAAVARRLC